MEFYWENEEKNVYVIYMKGNAYPLGKLYWCDECEMYHFESDFFNYDNDYSSDDDCFDFEDELLQIVKKDLVEDLRTKIQFMTEELGALGMM